jgi:hypothetical protein
MKFFIGAFLYLLGIVSVHSQSKLVGFQISPGVTFTHIIDLDRSPSKGLDANGFLRDPSDGNTVNESNGLAVTAGFNYEVAMNDKIFASTGLWFTSKNLSIRNTDGGYTGVSNYEVTYMQIPAAFKFYITEFDPAFKVYVKAGVSLDLKIKETLKGGDGAHYWNFAKNMTWKDQTRGRNGDDKPKALFSPLNIGILGAAGVEYKVNNDWIVFGSLTYNAGLFNMINPSLKYNDVNKTKVTDNLSIRTQIFTVDVGVALVID